MFQIMQAYYVRSYKDYYKIFYFLAWKTDFKTQKASKLVGWIQQKSKINWQSQLLWKMQNITFCWARWRRILYSSTGLQYIKRFSSPSVASSTDKCSQEFWWHIWSTLQHQLNLQPGIKHMIWKLNK